MLDEVVTTAAPDAPTRWRCLNCAYLEDGPKPPLICPICAAPAERFAALDTADVPPEAAEQGALVIIGAGVAGISAAEAAAQAAPQSRITVIGAEPGLPYYRLNLTRYLAGEVTREDLVIHPQSWYDERRIALLTGCEVTGIDAEERLLHLADGDLLPYDRLILAMGAHCFVPPVPGITKPGVVALRTVAEADALLEAVRPDVPVVCIGGGILGMETAAALTRRGARVTLLEAYDHLMPRQLDAQAGALLAAQAEALGITVLFNAAVAEITGEQQADGVLLSDGRRIPAELISVSVGVRPNSHLGRRLGLEVDKGLVVDQYLRTSQPDVFAAGDLAEHQGVLYGAWAPAQFMGTIAGRNAAGAPTPFAGIPRAHAIKVIGTEVVSIGMVRPEDGSYRRLSRQDGDHYQNFIIHDGRLVGAILFGDGRLAPAVRKAMEQGHDVAEAADAAGMVALLERWL